jgi:hypothetical protein
MNLKLLSIPAIALLFLLGFYCQMSSGMNEVELANAVPAAQHETVVTIKPVSYAEQHPEANKELTDCIVTTLTEENKTIFSPEYRSIRGGCAFQLSKQYPDVDMYRLLSYK